MKTVKARKFLDTTVTEQSREEALVHGSQRRGQGLHATAVEYLANQKVVFITFADFTGIGLPVAKYPELAGLSSST
jgi:hypothetical protein